MLALKIPMEKNITDFFFFLQSMDDFRILKKNAFYIADFTEHKSDFASFF